MLKGIQTFFLGLARASAKQIKELSYFALSILFYLPSLFITFYFVFVYGTKDVVLQFGTWQINFTNFHISLVIAIVLFVWLGFYKFLKTKLKEKDYGFGQVMIRFLIKTKYLVLFIGIINLFMLKFSLTRINTYGGIVIVCFFLSVLFESKYNKSAEVKWSDD